MVTCTAMAVGILQHPCQGHAGHHRRTGEKIVCEKIHGHQCPVTLLEEDNGLVSITRERGVTAAKANRNKQAPARVDDRAFGCPSQEEAKYEAAEHVDGKGAVREDRSKPAEHRVAHPEA